jgi:hypothetical protein
VLSLKGFQRVTLKPGESRQVSFPISFDSYKFWKEGGWVSEPGELKVMIGSSSAELPLKGSIPIISPKRDGGYTAALSRRQATLKPGSEN